MTNNEWLIKRSVTIYTNIISAGVIQWNNERKILRIIFQLIHYMIRKAEYSQIWFKQRETHIKLGKCVWKEVMFHTNN